MEGFDLIENFCSMHLGINIRKAFLKGIDSTVKDCNGSRQFYPVDTLVHEFCKLFGKLGVPEYGCGTSFQDFLELMSVNADTAEMCSYFQLCSTISLERQVGSRNFVSAANAARIFFLKEAALEFIRCTGKDQYGNKLEQSIYDELLNPLEIAYLKADSLMFYHVYADLVMLSKSTVLSKSVLDMNVHYLEQLFLEESEKQPEIVFDQEYRVFRSEQSL